MKNIKSSINRIAGVAACNLARLKPASLEEAKELLKKGFSARVRPEDREVLNFWAERWWNRRTAGRSKKRSAPSGSAMRLAGVARGNLTRSKEPIRTEQAAKDRLRRIYGSMVKRSELLILDRFASEWWAARQAQHVESQPNEGGESDPPVSVDDLKNVRKLNGEIEFFLENGLSDLDAVSDIVKLVNQLGGLERAKRAQKVLEKLINPWADRLEDSEGSCNAPPEQSEVSTATAS